jgi:hypothetical protein
MVPAFYQTFKEELTPILLKIFHEIEREGTLYYIILISRPNKNTIKKRVIDQSL